MRKYKKALAVVKTLDMRQVKGISDLSAIAEVYTKTEQFDAAKNTYLRSGGILSGICGNEFEPARFTYFTVSYR